MSRSVFNNFCPFAVAVENFFSSQLYLTPHVEYIRKQWVGIVCPTYCPFILKYINSRFGTEILPSNLFLVAEKLFLLLYFNIEHNFYSVVYRVLDHGNEPIRWLHFNP